MTLKRIMILYFSITLSSVIISKLFGRNIYLFLESIGFWILPFFAIAVGQFIGFIVNLASKKSQIKQKVFIFSYSIAFVGVVGVIFHLNYSLWRHERDYGFIEDNQDHFKYFGGPNMIQEKIAFDSLSNILLDPNSFLLNGGSMHKLDTTINGTTDTLYLTTLRYIKRGQEITWKAQFAVWKNTAKLIYHDVPLNKDDKARIDSLGRISIKNINDCMKILSEYPKKEIK